MVRHTICCEEGIIELLGLLGLPHPDQFLSKSIVRRLTCTVSMSYFTLETNFKLKQRLPVTISKNKHNQI